jgi:hypothetical protein
MHGEQGNACAVWCKKPEGERPLGRPRIRQGIILK